MADVVALRAALTRLGFSSKAAGFITDDQGLNTLDELKVLTNDEIEILCKIVWSPGGTATKPNAVDPGQPATLLNPREKVPLQAELNLKLKKCFPEKPLPSKAATSRSRKIVE